MRPCSFLGLLGSSFVLRILLLLLLVGRPCPRQHVLGLDELLHALLLLQNLLLLLTL